MEVLGHGHFASVRRGVHKETGEEVAIKLVAKVHPYHRHRNDHVAANRVAEVRREEAELRAVAEISFEEAADLFTMLGNSLGF